MAALHGDTRDSEGGAGDALKRRVIRSARRLGAMLIGFAPASRWAEYGEVPCDYRPASIWKPVQTVIVMGVPMLLPIIESTPSINYQEMYTTTNILLDQIGYRLSLFLNGLGFASIPMPRDGYGNLEILLNKMPGCFSHVYAGKYAGLGTIGYSHNLICPEYGPRARYVSVFTAAQIPGDPVLSADLCRRCELCGKLCPARALATRPGSLVATLDAIACTKRHQELAAENRWPCGTCAKVCPVGEDRKLYGSVQPAMYLREREALEKDPRHPDYKHLAHLRSHGSAGERLS